MTMAMPKFGVGASAHRKEDKRLVRGDGAYTADKSVPGQLHGYVLRSPHAAASFTFADLETARQADGVHLVMTASDVAHLGALPVFTGVTQPDGSRIALQLEPVLCDGEVRYVGDAIAFIVADTLAQAQDAAELVMVEWEERPAQTDTATALEDGRPLVWPETGSNRAFRFQLGDRDRTEAAFAGADHVVTLDLVNNRLASNYIEPRACLAEWDGAAEKFTLHVGSQGVHSLRRSLADKVFKLDREAIRVVTGDVGGGFGTKMFLFREYPLAMEAARRLGRPVKWVGDRTEHFMADSHGRDNVVTARMALDAKGRFLAVKVDMRAAMGAYLHQFGPNIPTIGVTMTTGVYDIPAMDVNIEAVYTHTAPVDAYRGAGRPEAAFLIERLVDHCAREIGIDPAELRRRNFIAPDKFPYKTPGGRNYDVGEFDGHMTRALEKADAAGFDERARAARAEGRLRGLGTAVYIEACAFAGSEAAFMELTPDGEIVLRIGTQSNGQGHETAYSQFIADKIGIDFEKIIVRQGDTDELAAGGGTGGSRSIPLGGVSVARAADILVDKIKALAADHLEAAAADIELVDGAARIVGTDRSVDYAALAAAAPSPEARSADADVRQDEATYPNGTHVCEVEIDPATGALEIVRYTVVDDFGMTVNPLLLLGQVHGGIVQGIGQALSEGVVYDADGQLLTASFMDYAMPRAGDLPFFEFETRNVPSTTNALGIKGAGEAGTIGSCPAVINAVIDALDRARGIRDIEMPVTPHKLWQALNG
ncbi:xanthine dehydrogenase family protein molybdopterin-binding subunit [Pseudohoeflea coraliihabitans]|uniref:Xanthine dehydrogenase family protein molybdopterin-binding subunit n=1 Tax=Pseudohoeflea coraliihabitans TaxID=2860393 RepID=A0ABS6WRU0_9HYPH|nr:xanthine dehydrogenase family protein molybdopterin-binding subunit [Pseudohoeflea sp. DP4N28-3]MBW3098687.1 xanthine dehydrogenase family protein molybdopterin-binding subunit [Pseudohoeflea sp. DP4N28-3]